MNDLMRRQLALEKTGERFRDKPFLLGTNDCGQMFKFHLKAMGHKKTFTGTYKSVRTAVAALRREKVRSLEELADRIMPRIPPAFMLPGDIALLESEDDEFGFGGGSYAIYLGSKFWGWHPDQEELAVLIIDMKDIRVAWRA